MGFWAAQASAVTLDWNSVDWTDPVDPPGPTSWVRDLDESFDIDPSNAGNDIRIQITNTGTWTNSASSTSNQPPNDLVDLTGGFSGQESLLLVMDNTNDTQGITVTITFLYAGGVTNVAYTLFDVDRSTSSGSNFIDEIRNFTVNGASSTNVFIDGSTANDVFNDGSSSAFVTGNSVAGDTTGNGNAGISYGNTAPIFSVSFFWGNDTSALSGDPTRQAIALGDITWTAVPEPSTYVAGSLLGLLAGWHALRRRRAIC